MTPFPFDSAFGKSISRKPTMLVITAVGESKLQHWEGGGLELSILQILKNEGPTSIAELQRKLQMDETKIRAVCNHMIHKLGWAQAQ